jgi:hypothetical protein
MKKEDSSEFTVWYKLSEAGQKADILAGCDGRKEKKIVVTSRNKKQKKILVNFAKIDSRGRMIIELSPEREGSRVTHDKPIKTVQDVFTTVETLTNPKKEGWVKKWIFLSIKKII